MLSKTFLSLIARKMSSMIRSEDNDYEFLQSVRGSRCDEFSDSEIRDTLSNLISSAKPNSEANVLPKVFALVNETISRRLGAWSVLTGDTKSDLLDSYRELADSLVSVAPYRSQVAYYTDESFLESPKFRQSLESLIDQFDLDNYEKTIVATMAYVAEASKLRYKGDILLEENFYTALKRNDTDKATWFQVTDEQLLAGRMLCASNIVEMNAGEGKTIAAAFPAVFHAAQGQSVHIVTANDYLASRDADWLAPVYESLGLSVRALLSHMDDAERKEAYRANVVYGTLREFGFDFLRDNIRYSSNELVQGHLDVAIVDEADLALIDESRTPLIISGQPSIRGRSIHLAKTAVDIMIEHQQQVVLELEVACDDPDINPKERIMLLATLSLADPRNAVLLSRLAGNPKLQRDVNSIVKAYGPQEEFNYLADSLFYTVEISHETVTTTEKGQDLLQLHLGPIYDTSSLEQDLNSVYSRRDISLHQRRKESEKLQREISRRYNQMNQVHQMLLASLLLKRNEDYIVSDGQIVLIDGLTGRRRPDSRYQHGLHSALEIKESITTSPDSEVIAQISIQGFVSQYQKISGITGTALPSAGEFQSVYGLDVVKIPPFKPSRRTDLPTRIYHSNKDKLTAVLEEVETCLRVGRPILVATLTVDQSKEISQLLDYHHIPHKLLNAVTNEDEAEVIRSAGRFGAVTISTNMAGRGTDIVLEPGLNERIIPQYLELVRQLTTDKATRVVLSCASTEVARIFESALRGSENLTPFRVTSHETTQLVITPNQWSNTYECTRNLEVGLGLHVIGTEMNESMRVDSQLRGRGGRQGEFGTSRFILSLQDSPIFHHWDTLPIPLVEQKLRISGNAYLEGHTSQRFLQKIQNCLEMDDESDRAMVMDYYKILERQSLEYYALRKEILENDEVDPIGIEVIQSWVTRLLDRNLPIAMTDHYANGFDLLAEELWLDYGLDINGLWGLGVEALSQRLVTLMISRLDNLRQETSRSGTKYSEKLLYMQISDQLWTSHGSQLQELMLGGQLYGVGHVVSTYRYLFDCIKQSEQFRDDVVDVFLPRLFYFLMNKTMSSDGRKDKTLAKDLQEILV